MHSEVKDLKRKIELPTDLVEIIPILEQINAAISNMK
jgi:hypothetical protein